MELTANLVNKQHLDVCAKVLQVAENGVKSDGDGIICRSVGPVDELVLV